MKIAIVAPCHIPPTKEWVEKLERERLAILHTEGMAADIIIVDDSNGNLGQLPVNWRIYDYPRQEEFLGELYSQFAQTFHKSSACRIFGHILAYSEDYDIVIGLDSDCEVRPNFVLEHLDMLAQKGSGWTNTVMELPSKANGNKWYARGFPYHMRDWPVVANMGLWSQTLDLNGKDREPNEPTDVGFPKEDYEIAVAPIPFSGMNFAVTNEAVPGFLFLPNFDYAVTLTHLMGTDGAPVVDKFRRIDDIWGGYIFQKIVKMFRKSVVFGHPVVDHISEVIGAEDAAEEAAMYKWEEEFIRRVDWAFSRMRDARVETDTFINAFAGFVAMFKITHQPDPFSNVILALEWWVKVWEKYGK